MRLPCKHIFAVRSLLNMDLFDKNLVLQHLTKSYYFEKQKIFVKDTDQIDINCEVDVSIKKPKKAKSQQQKYNEAFIRCKVIAFLASEASGIDFTNVMKNLSDVKEFLERNQYNFKVVEGEF